MESSEFFLFVTFVFFQDSILFTDWQLDQGGWNMPTSNFFGIEVFAAFHENAKRKISVSTLVAGNKRKYHSYVPPGISIQNCKL
jgi:hypothetical protein